MNGMKATGKTIGEVEKITGIPKRELKYYIEQSIMRPSQRTESGYWSYSGEDIQRARLTALCRSLNLPVRAIRTILADPASHWQEELERQIVRLTNRLDRTEAQLSLARRLQNHGAWESLQIYCDTLAEEDAELAAK